MYPCFEVEGANLPQPLSSVALSGSLTDVCNWELQLGITFTVGETTCRQTQLVPMPMPLLLLLLLLLVLAIVLLVLVMRTIVKSNELEVDKDDLTNSEA
jgi:hypothetical protein